MTRRLPPLTALRAFEAAARHLSFTRAAAELHVTPAAISHQVKALEQQLGVLLFRRLTRGLRLTDPGRAYLPGLTAGLDQLAQATERLTAGTVSGRLTVSVLPSLAARWLIHRLSHFRERYPDVDVVLRAENRAVDFAVEDVDVGIRYGRGVYPGLRTDLLMTEQVFPVCSPKLMNVDRPLRRMADLRHHTLLHDAGAQSSEPSLTWDTWLRAARLTDIDATRGPSFSDTALILQATIAGDGVALGRSALMGDDLRSGRLVRPFDVARPADYAYFVVSPEPSADTPKIAAFRAWILEQAALADDAGGRGGP